jgi:FkbM family methyltransferase
MKYEIKLKGILLKFYFLFKDKLLFRDGYGLSYYLYKNTRPNSAFDLGVRTDDTTVLHTIDKILSSSVLTNSDEINCIDVGGYIGVITLMMSNVLKKNKKKWRIHTFEPFEESFNRLKENVNLDPLKKNILLNEIAISDTKGISTLKTYEDAPGENHLHSNKSKKNAESISIKNIEVITLREYIKNNNINHINICKVDTEGSDYFVIKGLQEYLEKNIVDYFIFEYQFITFEKIKNILSTNGYTMFYLVRNENILINSIENYPKNCKSLLNCIAVSQEHKSNFIKKFNTE